ncbi:MAG: hypothetical protein U0641_12615 [Anaerolineae bacterium]
MGSLTRVMHGVTMRAFLLIGLVALLIAAVGAFDKPTTGVVAYTSAAPRDGPYSVPVSQTLYLPYVSRAVSCTAAFEVVPSPTSIHPSGNLFGIASVGPSDMWAVGAHNSYAALLTLHWNGQAWTRVPVPSFYSNYKALFGVAAAASNDVWAVGYYRDTQPDGWVEHVLVVHWDGVAWTRSALELSELQGQLMGVAAISATDVWAVGYGSDDLPLVVHWDGAHWTRRDLPLDGSLAWGQLNGVTAVGGAHVWAVGDGHSNTLAAHIPLAFHWNGATWTNVPVPRPDTSADQLLSVSGSSATDVWAVGSNALTVHWDGTGWTAIPAPRPGNYANTLYGVAAVGSAEAWAVGQAQDGAISRPLMLHWNGSAWTETSLPETEPEYVTSPALRAALALAPGNVWAVGVMGDDTTLTLHWTGATWDRIPSPNVGRPRSDTVAVTAFSDTDAWALGQEQSPIYSSYPLSVFIRRWDGREWTSVLDHTNHIWLRTPRAIAGTASDDVWVAGGSRTGTAQPFMLTHWDGHEWQDAQVDFYPIGLLLGLRAVARNDVWAVGGLGYGDAEPPLALHWDGMRWQRHEVPNPGQAYNTLADVAVVAPDNVWAVGWYADDWHSDATRTLIVHWNGQVWTQVPSPGEPMVHTELTGIAAASASDIWAVGWSAPFVGGPTKIVILHWNGLNWQSIDPPSLGLGSGLLKSVVARSAQDVWAVGLRTGTVTSFTPLVLRWDGRRWTEVATPEQQGQMRWFNAITVSPTFLWAVGAATDLNPPEGLYTQTNLMERRLSGGCR